MIQWLSNSPHGLLWGIALFIPFAAACMTWIDDEDYRHRALAICAAMLLSLLVFIGMLELTGCTIDDIVRRNRNLLGFRRRNPRVYTMIFIWLGVSYYLSGILLRLFYHWRDRRGEDDETNASDD